MTLGNQDPEVVEKEVFSIKGKTFVSVSLNGILLTINEKSICKVFELENSDKEEPEVIDTCESVAAFTPVFKSPTTNKWAFCLADRIQDNVYLYTHEENIAMAQPKTILRSFLDIKDICLVHGGKMLAVATDDLEVKLVSLEKLSSSGNDDGEDTSSSNKSIKVTKPVVNISFSHVLNILAVSCNDGSLSLWSLSSDTPRLVQDENGKDNHLSHYVTPNYFLNLEKEDGVASSDNLTTTSTSRVAFGEKNAVFACCDDVFISLYSITHVNNIVKQYKHDNKIVDFKYCGLDNYICLIDCSNRLVLWHVPTETVVFNQQITNDENKLTNIAWKKSNTDSNNFNVYCGTKNGNVIFIENILSSKNVSLLSTKSITGPKSGDKAFSGLFVDDSDNEDNDEVLANIKQRKEDMNNTISNGVNMMDGETALGGDNQQGNLNGGSKKKKNLKRLHYDDYDDLDEELKNLNNDSFADDDDDNEDADQDGFGGDEESDYENEDDRIARETDELFTGRSSNGHNKRVRFGSSPMTAEPLRPWSSASTDFHVSDRRYLTMNSIGYAWTVKSTNTQSVTVSFFDRSSYREYYFEDYNVSDVCSLGEKGILLANSRSGELTYRSHSTDSNRWSKTIPLQKNEIITSIALTVKKCFIGTSKGNFYELNSYGYIINLEKLSPVAAMIAFENTVFVVHKSATMLAGNELLTFSLFDDKKYYQRESILPVKRFMKNIFFTQYGDPAIFTHDNTLLLLNKWRDQRKSRWIPVLDISFELWRLSGGSQGVNDIHCWPLGVSGSFNNTLTYIMLKGSKRYPEFPLPLPTDMEIKIPILNRSALEEVKKQKEIAKKIRREENESLDNASDDEDNDMDSISMGTKELEIPQELNAEEEFLRSKICHNMLDDTVRNDGEMYGDEQATLDQLNTIYDKSLLRLFAGACSEGDVKKAYSLVIELKQDRAFGAATKIAERSELIQLAEKINQLRDARNEQEMDL